MKYVLVVLGLFYFSCTSNKKPLAETLQNDEVMVFYSKRRCFGKCEVYDLQIYTDGSVSFTAIDNLPIKGKYKTVLEDEEFKALKVLLSKGPYKIKSFKKIRDKQVIKLRFKNDLYKYYPSQVGGDLEKINIKLESIVRDIKVKFWK